MTDKNAKPEIRTTACWACHMPLDSIMSQTCPVCGWLICSCGACGCNRSDAEIIEYSQDALITDSPTPDVSAQHAPEMPGVFVLNLPERKPVTVSAPKRIQVIIPAHTIAILDAWRKIDAVG